MTSRRSVVSLHVLALAALLALLPASRALAWGSGTHHYIAQNYSQHLPTYMDGLRAYDATVDAHCTDADTRKPSTPGESYKHYIDIDVYPAFLAGTLTHSRAALEAQYGASTVLNNGVLPWAIGETVTTLTSQFAAQNWSGAALTIADLTHYVGDLNQPLHDTQNYDGGLTGNSGIHSRYETSMMSSHIAELHTARRPVAFVASPVDFAFDSIGAAWQDVAPIMTADNAAKAASGGAYNTTYYNALWSATQSFTRPRIDAATWMTASLVYTAWVNAGQPTVPGSSTGVAPEPLATLSLAAGPSPFRDALTVRWSAAGPVHIDVLDVRGARVARLADGAGGAGAATWRPGANGERPRPGVYFVRLSGANVSQVKRVTLLD